MKKDEFYIDVKVYKCNVNNINQYKQQSSLKGDYFTQTKMFISTKVYTKIAKCVCNSTVR